MRDLRKEILNLLQELYAPDHINDLLEAIWRRIEIFQQKNSQFQSQILQYHRFLNETDSILIVYGDQFQESERPPLESLRIFLNNHLLDVVNGLHILPFHTYSSDDGFSVIDYARVSSKFGSWQDITRLGNHFHLMFDLVINHVSSKSAWFEGFLQNKQPYTNYFHVLDPKTDLSLVVRPRSTPLLTEFQTSNGKRYVWTTFSADQIDLNYGYPQVLLEMIDVLLNYVVRGASIIRLDAIAYLWKIPGTTCIHLQQTHSVVKLLRAILDATSPHVLLITETNVPHEENISYFGNYVTELQRSDEAQIVYQFPLPPLILHTLIAGDATRLTNWAKELPELNPGITYLNFTASHDGIGLRPVEGLLLPSEIQALVERTLAHGGLVSYGNNSDGRKIAYELNITWYDALNDPASLKFDLDILRFIASQAIMLSFAGVPGIYIHSLFGSHNSKESVYKTGQARSINREKFNLTTLEDELKDQNSLKSRVLASYRQMLRIRRDQSAFDPAAQQKVLNLGPSVFTLVRVDQDGGKLICITNVTSEHITILIQLADLDMSDTEKWLDLIADEILLADKSLVFNLAPYQTRWMKAWTPGDRLDRSPGGVD